MVGSRNANKYIDIYVIKDQYVSESIRENNNW